MRVPPPLFGGRGVVLDRRNRPRARPARWPARCLPSRRELRIDGDRPHAQARPRALGLMAVAEPAIGWQRSAPPRIRRKLSDTAVGRVSNADRIAILGLVAVTAVCIAAPWIAPHSP